VGTVAGDIIDGRAVAEVLAGDDLGTEVRVVLVDTAIDDSDTDGRAGGGDGPGPRGIDSLGAPLEFEVRVIGVVLREVEHLDCGVEFSILDQGVVVI
jgi:hypothetical protein